MAPRLRRARAEDVPALTRLAADSFVDAFAHLYSAEDLAAFLAEQKSEAATAALIANPRMLVQLADDDGRLRGFCVLGLECGWPDHARGDRVMELKQLYLAGDTTGQGIGGALMDWAMGECAARGADEVQLSVYSGNHGAQRFYARHGFAKVADTTFRVGRQIDHEFLFARMLGG